MEISKDTVSEIIDSCWSKLKNRIETQDLPLSSEKTLVFLFAMELFKKVGNDLVVDFEHQCFEHLHNENKYLDLLFYTSTDFKVAIEFKLPQGTPDQKDTRKKIFRDLARLNNLSSRGEHKYCVFLMATNIRSFLNDGNYKDYPDYETAHEHKIISTNNITVDSLELQGFSCEFQWDNIEYRKNKTNENGNYYSTGRYAWLKPIVV